jgi:hypothetical protein
MRELSKNIYQSGKVSFDTGYSQAFAKKISLVQSSNIPPVHTSVGSNKNPGALGIHQPIQDYVDPFEVELNLNPVYYPSRAGLSDRPGEHPDQTIYLPDSERQRVRERQGTGC